MARAVLPDIPGEVPGTTTRVLSRVLSGVLPRVPRRSIRPIAGRATWTVAGRVRRGFDGRQAVPPDRRRPFRGRDGSSGAPCAAPRPAAAVSGYRCSTTFCFSSLPALASEKKYTPAETGRPWSSRPSQCQQPLPLSVRTILPFCAKMRNVV